MKITSEAKRSADKEVSKMVEKMEAMEQKYERMEAHVSRMTSNMQELLDKIGETSKNLEVPGTSNVPEDPLQVPSSLSSHTVPSDEIFGTWAVGRGKLRHKESIALVESCRWKF